jgi:hypothetical protein
MSSDNDHIFAKNSATIDMNDVNAGFHHNT